MAKDFAQILAAIAQILAEFGKFSNIAQIVGILCVSVLIACGFGLLADKSQGSEKIATQAELLEKQRNEIYVEEEKKKLKKLEEERVNALIDQNNAFRLELLQMKEKLTVLEKQIIDLNQKLEAKDRLVFFLQNQLDRYVQPIKKIRKTKSGD